MPELRLANVSKYYGETLAVDNLSLTIADGEFVCLLGPSGCGKTTALRMIAGFETVDKGSIHLDGEDITRKPPQLREIGLVFQHYALFPHMTVAENVGYGLRVRGKSRAFINGEVANALALVRLGELGARYPAQLSGGQQQRVALARALAIRPRLLLLDEPLSNLDAKLRDDMREEIRNIQRKVGITAIFVTHDQSEAFGLSDRVAVMSFGKLQQIAAPAAVYESPASIQVGSFIGSINDFKGEVAAVDGASVRVDIGGGIVISGSAAHARQGATVTAVVKQERITLSPERPAAGDNVFPCRIGTRTYLGSTICYRCEAEGFSFGVIVPNNPHFAQFETGQPAVAHWSGSDCHVFM